jgi:hypothetical protein
MNAQTIASFAHELDIDADELTDNLATGAWVRCAECGYPVNVEATYRGRCDGCAEDYCTPSYSEPF